MILAAETETCYADDGSLCKWVYDHTDGNEYAANFADWFIGAPLSIAFILLAAWLGARLSRRWISSGVPRIISTRDPATERLAKLGIDLAKQPDDSGHRPRDEARTAAVTTVLSSTATVAIWSVACVTILGLVGIHLGPLLAGAGIAGVALGFGAQGLVKDCIAGLFMLIEDQYGIGDFVDLGEASGAVEKITLRATVLRSADGTVWHVPNGVVQRVGNRSQLWSMALIDVDVAYATDLEHARHILHQTAVGVCEQSEHSGLILGPPKVLGVERLGADGITLRLTIKVAPGEQFGIQRTLREQIKQAFDASDIGLPFPQRTVWVHMEDNTPNVSEATS